MSDDTWQVSRKAAEIFETVFVPAIFKPWAPRIADAAGIGPGQRVLDIACGTGVVARECARRGAKVTGLDLNEGMLSVAAGIAPEIDWRQGDACDLPFDDGAFDAAVCQFGLMFFPDRIKALGELWRVLAPGGRLAVSVWDALEQTPIYETMAGLIERHAGVATAKAFRSPFALGDKAGLAVLFHAAGIEDFEIDTPTGTDRYDSFDAFVEVQIKGSPLAEFFDDRVYAALLDDARIQLPKHGIEANGFEYVTSVHMARTTKPFTARPRPPAPV